MRFAWRRKLLRIGEEVPMTRRSTDETCIVLLVVIGGPHPTPPCPFVFFPCSIAFPCLYSEAKGYPREQAAHIAMSEFTPMSWMCAFSGCRMNVKWLQDECAHPVAKWLQDECTHPAATWP